MPIDWNVDMLVNKCDKSKTMQCGSPNFKTPCFGIDYRSKSRRRRSLRHN